MIYIQKDTAGFVELSAKLKNDYYEIGNSWEDYLIGKWILLSKNQENFLKANPNASKKEVFDITLCAIDMLQQLRFEVLNKVLEADKNASVFYANSVPMWLDKDLRNSLLNVTIPALESSGVFLTQLWVDGEPPTAFDVPTAMLKQAIPALELYAKAVYDNTQRLKVAVYSVTEMEELNAIEITGYPEPLKFDIQ